MVESGGGGQALPPFGEAIRAAQPVGGFGRRIAAGARVQGAAQPVEMRLLLVRGGPGFRQVRRRDHMAAGQCLAELAEQARRVGRTLPGQACHLSERERVHRLVAPLIAHPRHDGKAGLLQRPVDAQLALEPLDACGLAGEQEHAVPGEQDVLVPSGEVSHQVGAAQPRDLPEALQPGRDQHGPERITYCSTGHDISLP